MKVFVDLVLFLNFFIDFNILLSVGIILKRKTSINRLLISSFIGSLSVMFLFLNINSLMLFLYKVLMCLVMCIICFKYESFKYTLKNYIYTFLSSFILGGFLTYINNSFSLKRVGFVFINNGYSINFIIIIILTPILFSTYIYLSRSMKLTYNNYYDVSLMINNKSYDYVGFMDSGNRVVDPIFRIPVVFIDKRKVLFDVNEFEMNLVPIKTASGDKLIKCFKSSIVVNKKTFNKIYLGIMDDCIMMDGVDIILNSCMEVI